MKTRKIKKSGKSKCKGKVKSKSKQIRKFSNPQQVYKNAKQYFGIGHHVPITLSTKKEKKYMVQNPDGKWIHFGQMGYEDYTKHHDKKRRQSYLRRSRKIRGHWKSDKYAPNSLSINLLW